MKKINWFDVLAVLFMVGCVVVSIAFVNLSYTAGEEMPNVLRTGLRIVGFFGCLAFPYVFDSAIAENRTIEYYEGDDEPAEWSVTADLDYTEWD